MSAPTARWDSEEAALEHPDRGRFAYPQYSGRSLPNLAATLYAASHRAPGDSAPLPLPPLAGELDALGGRPAEGPVILLMVDSLGWKAFRASVASPRRGRPAALGRWAELAHPISSVFPSTTTAALTALSTASAPGQNGIVGHRQFLPRWGVVADMLRMAPMAAPGHDTLLGPGWSRGELTPVPTLFERGWRAAVVSRERFAGSGFTRLLYQGAEYRPYSAASEIPLELAELVNRPDPPEVVYAYWDELDTAHHLRGPDPFLLDLELDRLVGLVEATARRVEPARRRAVSLWVTGDHGQVPAPAGANVALERHPELLAELRHPPAGDRRAGFFDVREGRDGPFEERLRGLLPPDTLYRRLAPALSEGLFGPPPYHPEIALRVGTHLAVPPSPVGLTYTPPGDPVPRRLFAGAHSGLEREELWVPLIAGPLSELGAEGA